MRTVVRRMSVPAPSKQALRHLARLCTSFHNSKQLKLATPSPQPSRKIYTSCPRIHQSILHFRPFSTSPSSASSSSSQQPSDQQQPPPLPDITNHYTLFPSTLHSGPPPSGPFAIPLPSLRREYLRLQAAHHPDKYPSEPAHSKALALSALINTSYKTLSDPLLRAQYLLLTKYDIDVTSEDNNSHPTDQATLMEVMEAQERIEDAGDRAEIDALLEENNTRIESTMQKMAEAFENDDGDTAKNECVRLKYWRSLQDGLKDWEPGKEVRLVH